MSVCKNVYLWIYVTWDFFIIYCVYGLVKFLTWKSIESKTHTLLYIYINTFSLRSFEYNGTAPSRLFKKDLNKYTLGFYLFWTAHDEHWTYTIYVLICSIFTKPITFACRARAFPYCVYCARENWTVCARKCTSLKFYVLLYLRVTTIII